MILFLHCCGNRTNCCPGEIHVANYLNCEPFPRSQCIFYDKIAVDTKEASGGRHKARVHAVHEKQSGAIQV